MMRTSPVSVNLMALPTRLSSTCVSRCSSPRPCGRPLATSVLQRQLLGRGERLGGHPHGLDHAAQRILGQVQLELAGLDLGDVEHGVDQPEQVFAVRLDARRGSASPFPAVRRRCSPAAARHSRAWPPAGFAAHGSCWRRTATCAGWRSRVWRPFSSISWNSRALCTAIAD